MLARLVLRRVFPLVSSFRRPPVFSYFSRRFSFSSFPPAPAGDSEAFDATLNEPNLLALSRVQKYSIAELPQVEELFVDSPDGLAALVSTLMPEPLLGLDTEFKIYGKFSPQLALIQISSPSLIAVVDALTLASHLGPLLDVLFSKEIILHSYKGDLEILSQAARKLGLKRILPVSLFDTQIAAGYLGWAALIPFGSLLEVLFGLKADKADSLSEWTIRPLQPSQLKYAMNDVRYLIKARECLIKELDKLGRVAMASAEMNLTLNPALYQAPSHDDAWRQCFLRGRRLPELSRELCVLKEVYKVLYGHCERRDIHPMALMKPQTGVAIATHQPKNLAELKTIYNITPSALRFLGKEILEAVRVGQEAPLDSAPFYLLGHRDTGRLRPSLYNLIASRAQSVSQQLSLHNAYLAPRSEMFDLASVSDAALHAVARLAPEEFQPVPMPAIFFGLRSEAAPAELSTQPPSHFCRPSLSQVSAEKTRFGFDSTTQVFRHHPFSLEEEILMLKRLRIFSGWRRSLIGEDLLKVALGGQMSWNQKENSLELQEPRSQKLSAAMLEEALKVWSQSLTQEEASECSAALTKALGLVETARERKVGGGPEALEAFRRLIKIMA